MEFSIHLRPQGHGYLKLRRGRQGAQPGIGGPVTDLSEQEDLTIMALCIRHTSTQSWRG